MATISGGEKLERRLAELSRSVTAAAEVQVGWPADGETYPDGTPVAMVAALNEFGHGRTPPRPAFRTMVAKQATGWGDVVAHALKVSGMDAHKALAATGLVIEGQLAESIVDLTSPPLSPVTLMLRKWFWTNPQDIRGGDVGRAAAAVAAGESTAGVSDKPLVWTGTELGAIKSVVK